MSQSESPDSSRERNEDENIESATNRVSAHQTSPDRFVFAEDGYADAWIACDATLTESLER
ncbi:hypothetical protein [Haloquadratum walsbyi]|jgi:hypothetical protein|uniref:Uncharacterized protein n=1 Tax=Haloquadratum walsbyi J07HQW2 TaxID=1238425 RepID=U1PW04_9EURY|nr:hypothetical protein [Haloquadratum walsbyi]ERG96606.1 MAG: hypothetical protein J07HQW2_03086 [Haloquadratum walsbyi J07HQW2]